MELRKRLEHYQQVGLWLSVLHVVVVDDDDDDNVLVVVVVVVVAVFLLPPPPARGGRRWGREVVLGSLSPGSPGAGPMSAG